METTGGASWDMNSGSWLSDAAIEVTKSVTTYGPSQVGTRICRQLKLGFVFRLTIKFPPQRAGAADSEQPLARTNWNSRCSGKLPEVKIPLLRRQAAVFSMFCLDWPFAAATGFSTEMADEQPIELLGRSVQFPARPSEGRA